MLYYTTCVYVIDSHSHSNFELTHFCRIKYHSYTCDANIYTSGLDLAPMPHNCVANNLRTCLPRCFTDHLNLVQNRTLDFPSPNLILPSSPSQLMTPPISRLLKPKLRRCLWCLPFPLPFNNKSFQFNLQNILHICLLFHLFYTFPSLNRHLLSSGLWWGPLD